MPDTVGPRLVWMYSCLPDSWNLFVCDLLSLSQRRSLHLGSREAKKLVFNPPLWREGENKSGRSLFFLWSCFPACEFTVLWISVFISVAISELYEPKNVCPMVWLYAQELSNSTLIDNVSFHSLRRFFFSRKVVLFPCLNVNTVIFLPFLQNSCLFSHQLVFL